MRTIFLSIVSLLFVGAFVVYMFTYTVRFTEVAVVTTLGKASDTIVSEPGLKFKLPSPIQSTTVYDKRVRVLRTRSETIATADSRQIVVETYMTWRVSDPLVFYQRFRSSGSDAEEHYKNAEETLIAQLRGEMSSVVGRYPMSDLFRTDPSASNIASMEEDLTQAMRTLTSDNAEGGSAFGVEVVDVGVLKLVLPEDVTQQVFELMKASRTRIASEEISAGNAEFHAISNRAKNSAERIRAVTKLYASTIRARGDQEAARYLSELDQNPELAVFLKQTEFLRQGLGRNTTLVLPGSVMRLFAPESLESLMRGELPAMESGTIGGED